MTCQSRDFAASSPWQVAVILSLLPLLVSHPPCNSLRHLYKDKDKRQRLVSSHSHPLSPLLVGSKPNRGSLTRRGTHIWRTKGQRQRGDNAAPRSPSRTKARGIFTCMLQVSNRTRSAMIQHAFCPARSVCLFCHCSRRWYARGLLAFRPPRILWMYSEIYNIPEMRQLLHAYVAQPVRGGKGTCGLTMEYEALFSSSGFDSTWQPSAWHNMACKR